MEGVQYLGLAGVTQSCVDAVAQLLQADSIATARVLTKRGRPTKHALLLTTHDGDPIFVPSGFTSGYGGEGPTGFSLVLGLLESLHIRPDEIAVTDAELSQVDSSRVTKSTLRALQSRRGDRAGVYDYISQLDSEAIGARTLWRRLDLHIPLGIVEPRLVDIARGFWQQPDERLAKGFRRLEEDLRGLLRNQSNEPELRPILGEQLVSKAFRGDNPRFTWESAPKAECEGRANILSGAFLAYRNPRAHRERRWEDDTDLLQEFLLLNHAFALLRTAVPAS